MNQEFINMLKDMASKVKYVIMLCLLVFSSCDNSSDSKCKGSFFECNEGVYELKDEDNDPGTRYFEIKEEARIINYFQDIEYSQRDYGSDDCFYSMELDLRPESISEEVSITSNNALLLTIEDDNTVMQFKVTKLGISLEMILKNCEGDEKDCKQTLLLNKSQKLIDDIKLCENLKINPTLFFSQMGG